MPKLRNLVSAERRALAEDLAGLAEAQWNSPSLCTGWTVRDVVAHLSAIASLHAPRLVLGLAKSRLSFADFANTEIQRHLGATPPRRWPNSARCEIAQRRRGWVKWLSMAPTSVPPWHHPRLQPWRRVSGDRLLQGHQYLDRRQEPHRRPRAARHRRGLEPWRWSAGRGSSAVASAGHNRPPRRLRRPYRPRSRNSLRPLRVHR